MNVIFEHFVNMFEWIVNVILLSWLCSTFYSDLFSELVVKMLNESSTSLSTLWPICFVFFRVLFQAAYRDDSMAFQKGVSCSFEACPSAKHVS